MDSSDYLSQPETNEPGDDFHLNNQFGQFDSYWVINLFLPLLSFKG